LRLQRSSFERRYSRCGHSHRRKSFARDGIADIARLEANQPQRLPLQKARQQARGIGAPQMDVATGMPALESGQRQIQRQPTRRDRLVLLNLADRQINPAGAADIQLAPLFGIQIEQQLALQNAGLQRSRAGHSRFLIQRQQHFQRAVDQRFIFQCGQCSGDANTVIRPQGRPLGTDPATVDFQLQGITKEIVRMAAVLLADHVQVRLQDHPDPIGHARACRLANDQIAAAIKRGFQPARIRPSPQMIA